MLLTKNPRKIWMIMTLKIDELSFIVHVHKIILLGLETNF